MYRHSAAHLLAAATLELFPETKLGIGPPTAQGFFYDMYREKPFTPDDLEKIEARMREIAKRDPKNERVWIPRDEALAEYERQGEFMKCELVEEKTDEPKVSVYKTGDRFTDSAADRMCLRWAVSRHSSCYQSQGVLEGRREPRTPAARVRYRVLLEEGPRWPLNRLEEAKKRDHRKLDGNSTCSASRNLPGRA